MDRQRHDEEADPAGRIALLAEQYGFMPTNIDSALKMFIAPLTPQQIAALRCDTSVDYIQQNEPDLPTLPRNGI